PLSLALEAQNVPMIKLLLEHGATLDFVKEEIIVKFVIKGPYAPVHTWVYLTYKRYSAFQLAGNNDEIIKTLIYYQCKKQVPLNDIPQELVEIYKKYEGRHPALHMAIFHNDERSFQLLLEYGADPTRASNAQPLNAVKFPYETNPP